METIIYFQRKRSISEPIVEPVGMKRYMLIRVYLDVDKCRWFALNFCKQTGLDAEPFDTEPFDMESFMETFLLQEKRQQKRKQKKGAKKFIPFWRARREGEAEKKTSSRVCETEILQMSLQKLVREINALTVGEEDIYAVYEDALKEILLSGTDELSARWTDIFTIPEFSRWTETFWAGSLFPTQIPEHMVVLGTAPCVFELLEQNAHRLKSIRWILLRADYTSRIAEFADTFYIEYGLVIVIEIAETIAQLRRISPTGSERSCIADFLGETILPLTDVTEGSIWLDMYSAEEKQRKITCRSSRITYVSWKEKWKRARKRCNCHVLP